ncbi:MAG: PGPGW domain-containing protein [Acidothermaceae bacterium]
MTSSWKLIRRLAITVVGLVVLLIGVVLIVAPGPGFLVIALGLLILSLEYEWARRNLERVKSRARTVADQAAANRLSTTLSVLFALGVIGLGGVLALSETLPGSGLATGASIVFGGLVTLSTIVYSVVQRRRNATSATTTDAADK